MMTKSIIFCGFPRSGKTKFGRRIAPLLSLPFIDTDQKILERAPNYQTVRDLALDQGEDAFRKLECEVVADLPTEPHVIAVGGGTVMNPALVAQLKEVGRLVFLDLPLHLVKGRLAAPPYSSLLDQNALTLSIDQFVEGRHPVYKDVADLIVPIDGSTTPKEIIAHVL